MFPVSSRPGLSWEESTNNWNQLDITGEYSNTGGGGGGKEEKLVHDGSC